ncbi:phosphotyrosine protein phosphatase [Fodinicola acaciae]|uniref:arsenate reductase/protein-tyrosine-phosphatase family protein n=1 Tax=Fodinicola acaciae TaxID=2681555 RepID=UPI0013D21BB9|nr:phosphotyrosine protein phosphatase [Fodinicola acaciae]
MPPFTVLHVCMGNICRSPMAERLLAARMGDAVYSHSAGVGPWHAGEPMERNAARELRHRDADPSGFRARHLRTEHVESSDLVLTATVEQSQYVGHLVAGAAARTFVLGEFGRLLPRVDLAALPPYQDDPAVLEKRGVALVAAVDAARAGAEPRFEDEIADPYARPQSFFSTVADSIEDPIRALVRALTSH